MQQQAGIPWIWNNHRPMAESTLPLGHLQRYREIIADWPAFVRALGEPQAPVIWTNTLRTTPRQLAERLEHEGHEVSALPWNPQAFRLAADARPGRSLLFLTGQYHVQEEVSLVPVVLLDPQPGDRLLDLCAAPGNKTLQAAVRMTNRGSVLANDLNEQRVGVIRRNIDRLGITCVAISTTDAGNLPRECGLFDRVLADVPCSCEGTSRRNPEVLSRRSAAGQKAGAQLAILKKALAKCRIGGRVVYSTCTYAPEENEAVVDRALQDSEPGSFRLLPARLPGLRVEPGLDSWQGETFSTELHHAARIYPHLNNSGGFFVAVLERVS